MNDTQHWCHTEWDDWIRCFSSWTLEWADECDWTKPPSSPQTSPASTIIKSSNHSIKTWNYNSNEQMSQVINKSQSINQLWNYLTHKIIAHLFRFLICAVVVTSIRASCPFLHFLCICAAGQYMIQINYIKS